MGIKVVSPEEMKMLTNKKGIMKKTILAMLMAGSSCAVFAQVDSMNRGTTDQNLPGSTLNSNNSYNAYGTFNASAPDYVSSYVLRDYPMATDLHWQQSTDWWHGYYQNNGQPMHVYYNTAGQTFTASLPVKQSLIPDAVVSRANSTWGPSLYDITAIKGNAGQQVYLVRTIENGQLSSQWIGEDGSKVLDVYRVDNTDPMMTNTTNGTMSNGTNGTMGSSINSSSNGSMNNSSNGTLNNSNGSMNSNSNGTLNNSSNINRTNTGSMNNTTNGTNTNSSSSSNSSRINDADGVMSNTSTTGGTTNDKAQADDSATGTGTTGTASSDTSGNGNSTSSKVKATTPSKKASKSTSTKTTTTRSGNQ